MEDLFLSRRKENPTDTFVWKNTWYTTLGKKVRIPNDFRMRKWRFFLSNSECLTA